MPLVIVEVLLHLVGQVYMNSEIVEVGLSLHVPFHIKNCSMDLSFWGFYPYWILLTSSLYSTFLFNWTALTSSKSLFSIEKSSMFTFLAKLRYIRSIFNMTMFLAASCFSRLNRGLSLLAIYLSNPSCSNISIFLAASLRSIKPTF